MALRTTGRWSNNSGMNLARTSFRSPCCTLEITNYPQHWSPTSSHSMLEPCLPTFSVNMAAGLGAGEATATGYRHRSVTDAAVSDRWRAGGAARSRARHQNTHRAPPLCFPRLSARQICIMWRCGSLVFGGRCERRRRHSVSCSLVSVVAAEAAASQRAPPVNTTPPRRHPSRPGWRGAAGRLLLRRRLPHTARYWYRLRSRTCGRNSPHQPSVLEVHSIRHGRRP